MLRTILEKTFYRLGAALRIQIDATVNDGVSVDVQNDVFVARLHPTTELQVIDLQPRRRHLLLLARTRTGLSPVRPGGRAETRETGRTRFLCGHDERHWFVAEVSDLGPVTSIDAAMQALKPFEVRLRERRLRVRAKARLRRRNRASVRQGEWFFVPQPDLVVPPLLERRQEPLQRGPGSQAHVAEFGYRTGGEVMYLSKQHPQALPEPSYRRLLRRHAEAQHWRWWTMQRAAAVFVRGHVRHPDHRTIYLPGWHQVLLNGESRSGRVAFFD